jgi:uncharacterized membrane protein
MANITEQINSESSPPARIPFGVFIGRIVGSILGSCLGLTIGAKIGGSLAPLVAGIVGMLLGAMASDLLFKAFPRLLPGRSISTISATTGLFGLVLGFFTVDAIATFSGLDILYADLVGASLGLYIGILIGNARK